MVVGGDFPLYNFHLIVGGIGIPGVHPDLLWERLFYPVASSGGAIPAMTVWLEEERSSSDSSVCHLCSAGTTSTGPSSLNIRLEED